WRGRRLTRRLSKAVGRASVGTDPLQRANMLDQLAARRHALALATVPLPSPWSPVQSTATAATVPSQSASRAPVPVGGPHGPDELDGDRGPSTPRGPVPQVGPAQTPDQRTNPAPDHADPTLQAAQKHGPASADHDAPADQGHRRTTDQPTKPASADQIAPAPDQRTTTAPDNADQAADHDAPAADRRTASDQQEATREKRTSIAAGHTADSLSLSSDYEHADHESGPAEEPGAAGADHGSAADQDRLRTTDHAERTTDQPTKSALADHDAPAPDQRTNPAPDRPADHDEDDSSGGPNGARATDHSGSPDAPRTKPADQEDEVPWEVKVEVARKAALEEGRMTRRAIRPHLRRHNISISHALFSDLQAALYADPALAHLPRETRRKTR
ncbi:hypothetical protein PBV88_12655, partial [Streptomyces sp. T21Q-yed]|nr:hypothetical protein [Streptomyces sp. T21Q-yed]